MNHNKHINLIILIQARKHYIKNIKIMILKIAKS
jgi:hypothetical protein